VRVNGRAAVGLGIVKQSTTNTLPPGMKINVGFDSSIFIEKSIDAVYKTMLEAMVLVVGVIFLFLRNWRATLIPFVTIPVSLIGAFIFLYAMGFTINVLTLLGLVLAIGWWSTMPSSCWKTSTATWRTASRRSRRR
jgi:multidrug efflux pump